MMHGNSRSIRVISPCGYITRGKAISTAPAMVEASIATAIPSHTTCGCGRSVVASAWASPRFNPSVAINAASSTTTSASANRPTASGP